MKKRLCILLIICALILCACAAPRQDKWDCSVVCVENAFVYSDQRITLSKGALTFQNRSDFDISVQLLTDGKIEREADIPVGGISTFYQLENDVAYTVGCRADAPQDADISLMVYDGETAEVYK